MNSKLLRNYLWVKDTRFMLFAFFSSLYPYENSQQFFKLSTVAQEQLCSDAEITDNSST